MEKKLTEPFYGAILRADKNKIILDLRDWDNKAREFKLTAKMALLISDNWPDILQLLSEKNDAKHDLDEAVQP